MRVFIVKTDHYHEPTYHGFGSHQQAELYIEQHILTRMYSDPTVSRRCLELLKNRDIQAAAAMWAEDEGEYLTVFDVSLDTALSEKTLEGLRGEIYQPLEQ